jgi:hypothetical protein
MSFFLKYMEYYNCIKNLYIFVYVWYGVVTHGVGGVGVGLVGDGGKGVDDGENDDDGGGNGYDDGGKDDDGL